VIVCSILQNARYWPGELCQCESRSFAIMTATTYYDGPKETARVGIMKASSLNTPTVEQYCQLYAEETDAVPRISQPCW
jgi:hypothetical protein